MNKPQTVKRAERDKQLGRATKAAPLINILIVSIVSLVYYVCLLLGLQQIVYSAYSRIRNIRRWAGRIAVYSANSIRPY